MEGPKVLFIDIETAPAIIASWSIRSPDAGAVWVERDSFILMASYKWAHEKKVRSICLPDFKGYKRNPYCDKALCGELHKLLDEATHVIAHNGDSFDIKKINSRLIINQFKPPSPFKKIDTLKISRGAFKFDSNKMDNIGGYLKIGHKVSHTGAPLWRGCVSGDPEAWSVMRIYCERDTEMLAQAYRLLRAWAPTHPDMRLYGAKGCCPTCDSNNVQRRGIAVKLKSRYQRLQCRDCGAWHTGGKIDDSGMPKRSAKKA